MADRLSKKYRPGYLWAICHVCKREVGVHLGGGQATLRYHKFNSLPCKGYGQRVTKIHEG